MQHHDRRRDDDPTILTIPIKREVPLWSVLVLIGIAFANAMGMYNEQRELRKDLTSSNKLFEDKLESIRASQEATNRQIIELAKQMGGKDLKDTEHDLKLQDLERRLSTVEVGRGARR